MCCRSTPECVVHQCVVGLHQSVLYTSVLYVVHQLYTLCVLYTSVLYVVHQCVVGLHQSVLYISVLYAYTRVCCRPTPECVVHQCFVGLHQSALYICVL